METKTKDWKLLVWGNKDEIGEDNVCFDKKNKNMEEEEEEEEESDVWKKKDRGKVGPADFFFFWVLGFFVYLIFVFSVFFFFFFLKNTFYNIKSLFYPKKTLFFLIFI